MILPQVIVKQSHCKHYKFIIEKFNGGMPSIPGALFFFNMFRAAVISLSTIGSSRMGTNDVTGGLQYVLSVLLSRRDLK